MKARYFFLMFFGPFLVTAQNKPTIVPPYPTILEYEKYIKYLVNLNTGVPEISIPLYTIKEGNIDLAGTKNVVENNYRRVFWNTTSITLSRSAIVDNVRLYPADAQMTTYTYDPLVGMSSETDAAGRITYYEYDGAPVEKHQGPERQHFKEPYLSL